MKQFIKRTTLLLLLLLAVAGGQVGYAQSDSSIVTSDTTVFACDSFVWHDSTYTQTGEYTYMSEDSTMIVTLHLTVNHPDYSSTTIDTCESYTWTDGNGQTYTTSGDYTYSHEDANGCTQVDTLHLTIKEPTSGEETVSACVSYVWHEQTYTKSSDYTWTTMGINGCDSVATLHLIILKPTHTSITVTECDSFTWPANGQTYIQSNDYTYIHTDSNGCTQVDTLHLTINKPVHLSITDTACESYTWNNATYTASGIYTYSHQDTHGCWQVDTLHLTINHPVTVHFDTAICSSSLPLTWHDTTFEVGTVSGDYILHRKTVHNCDSVVTMTLSVNPIYNFIDTKTICASQLPYEWNGVTFAAAGTKATILNTVKGCDSVVTMTLTVNPTYNVIDTKTICASQLPYEWNGVTFAAAGTKTTTLNTVNGCDSVVTMTLTVNPTYNVIDTTTICASQLPYEWNGVTFAAAGTKNVTLQSVNYCDSIVAMTLTVNPTYNTPITESICQGQSYSFYGQNLTTAGVYTHTLTTSKGCDSIITLTLTVNPLPTVIISGDGSFCQGDNVTLTAMGASSYAWNNASTNPSITVCDAGTYTVTGTDANGCADTARKTVTVNPTYNITVHDTICQGESYNFFGQNLYTDSTYTHTLFSSKGCDSVITLILTVNPLPNITISGESSFCQGDNVTLTAMGASSYDWNNGSQTATTTVSTGGIYTVTGTDTNGCRNTATQEVTETPTVISTITAIDCEEYTWNGTVYYTSGDYTQTLTAANGCDSIVTLHLAIHHGTHNVFAETACESYTWHGTTCTASGTYTYPYINEYGCPSEDTLHLTVNYGIHNVFAETACESYTWHGTTCTASGIYTYLYTTADGCASEDTLHLIINHPVHTATSVTMCDSYTWAEGTGQTYTTSGTYTYAHQDSHGCMQVDTLHLVINPNPTPFIVGDSTICYGKVATLTAAGGETYQWSTEDVGNSIVVAMEGLYTVTATNMYGCSSTAEFTVSIAASPLVKKAIVGKSHADGSYYMLIYPEADLQYQWYKNNVVIIGATKQYYYPSDYTLEGSLDMDACYQVEVRPNDPYLCGIMTDCWEKPESVAEKIRILPNPNDGRFRLMLPVESTEVQILNANGQVVMSRKVDGTNMLDLSVGLANGFYIVKVFRENGEIYTEKLVINR